MTTLFLPQQPRTRHGKPWGRPRGDVRVVAVLRDEWMPLSEIRERLGLSLDATRQALLRARRRGLVEHRRGRGYRRAEAER
jgi:DNA-binding transcriptional regulator GbsR (MarR family)